MSFWSKKRPLLAEIDQRQAAAKELAEFAAETLGKFYADLIAQGIPKHLVTGLFVEFSRELMDLPTPEIINNNYINHDK